jgi:hypothetical protein
MIEEIARVRKIGAEGTRLLTVRTPGVEDFSICCWKNIRFVGNSNDYSN